MTKGDSYHGSITILPDGRVYTGEHQNSAPENQKLYAKLHRPTEKGLAGKVMPMQDKTSALFARIVNEKCFVDLQL